MDTASQNVVAGCCKALCWLGLADVFGHVYTCTRSTVATGKTVIEVWVCWAVGAAGHLSLREAVLSAATMMAQAYSQDKRCGDAVSHTEV